MKALVEGIMAALQFDDKLYFIYKPCKAKDQTTSLACKELYILYQNSNDQLIILTMSVNNINNHQIQKVPVQ
jgi:hypothetical protein